MSLKALADKFGVSPNAIRKRISSMEKKGIIERYVVELSRAMVDVQVLFSLVYTDKSIDDDTFAEMVFEHPKVYQVHYDSFGSCIVISEISGPEEMKEISSFFRKLDSVTEVEVHLIPIPRGKRSEITNLQLRVIAPLLENPRMRITEIARHTNLPARRIRRVLNELLESRSILFTLQMNIAQSDISFIAYRVVWDPKVIEPIKVGEMLREKFPDEFWRLNHSATEAVMWIDFLIESNRVSEEIVRVMRDIPSLDIRNTILVYPPKKRRNLRAQALRELVEEAGFL